MALGQVSYKYLRFPIQFSFHEMPHTYLSFGAGKTGQLVIDVSSGITPPHETKESPSGSIKADNFLTD